MAKCAGIGRQLVSLRDAIRRARHPICAGIAVLIGNVVLVDTNAFSALPWLDIPFHFVGSLIVGFTAMGLFARDLAKIGRFSVIVCIMGAAALVGILWEFFEVGVDTVLEEFQFPRGITDTLKDLAIDLAGGFTASIYYILFRK